MKTWTLNNTLPKGTPSYWMLAVDELDGFEQSTVVDGAGNGILGIGALLLGADRVSLLKPTRLLYRHQPPIPSAMGSRRGFIRHRWIDEVLLDDVDIIVRTHRAQREKADRFLEAAFDSKATSIHVPQRQSDPPRTVGKEHGWDAERFSEPSSPRRPTHTMHNEENRRQMLAVFQRRHAAGPR